LYGWQPYLHNPALLDRLHRVRRPSLVITGGQDGFVLAEDHVSTLCAALGGKVEQLVVLDAGHQLEEQRPDELAEHVARFARDAAPTRR
jgi:pimeloyl-ACP methyl ester carboxylesterase